MDHTRLSRLLSAVHTFGGEFIGLLQHRHLVVHLNESTAFLFQLGGQLGNLLFQLLLFDILFQGFVETTQLLVDVAVGICRIVNRRTVAPIGRTATSLTVAALRQVSGSDSPV